MEDDDEVLDFGDVAFGSINGVVDKQMGGGRTSRILESWIPGREGFYKPRGLHHPSKGWLGCPPPPRWILIN